MMLDDPRRRLLDLLAQKTADPEMMAMALQAVAVADGVSSDPVAPDPTDVTFAEGALAAAALRGRFAPDDRDIPKGCGAILGTMAETVVQDGRALLALKTGPRMQALAALRDDGVLGAALARQRNRAGDPLGTALRALLRETLGRGEPAAPSSLTDKALEARLQAAEWFAAAPEGWPPALTGAADGLRRETALRTSRRADAAMTTGFSGRKRELGILAGFLRRSGPVGDPPRILAISGPGGTGKSALIASLLDRLRRSRRKVPWLILRIDFDRRVLTAADPVQMTFEVTRQLGLQIPDLGTVFSGLRRDARTAETTGDATRKMLARIGQELAALGQRDRDVVLVLDSLDAAIAHADRSGDDTGAAGAIRGWLRMLVQDAGLQGLRVILAGRGIDGAEGPPLLAETVLQLQLLDRTAATTILQGRTSLGRGQAEQLAATFEGNPRILKSMAQLVSGPDPVAVARIVSMAQQDATGQTNYLSRADLIQGADPSAIVTRIKADEKLRQANARFPPPREAHKMTRPTGFRSEALNSLASLHPQLVQAARDKVEGSPSDRRVVLEGYRGALAPTEADRVVERRAGFPVRNEAIILREVRPPLLVRDGSFVMPDDPMPEVAAQLALLEGSAATMVGIRAAIGLAGRIAFVNVPGRGHHGTGWVIRREADDSAIVVTNRHVAEAFAYADGRGAYAFRTLPNYADMALEFDLIQEHDNPARQDSPVMDVLYIAPSRGADIGLLRVRGDGLRGLTQALGAMPATQPPRDGMNIGVVGYPGFSPDADPADQYNYFKGIFDVKRIGFGLVRSTLTDAPEFTHDATTLGGNSGSVVFDTDTGGLVGLHYGGITGTANYAVRIDEVVAALNGLEPRSVSVGLPGGAPAVPTEAVSVAGRFRGRDGYSPVFLGDVPLLPPQPGPGLQDALSVAKDDDTGADTTELKYRHFSIWMSRDRLLPLVTAVNIDGMQPKRMGRSDKWFLDHRLPPEAQVDDKGYKNNALDRGHMVRREDPIWGPLPQAEEANLDSFCFTNAAPQHEGLNQQDWRRLEDYVLSAARARGLRVSVFTGPVFRDDDPLYRRFVRIPMAFWKIVAVVDDATGKLSVTAYVLTQGDLIRTMTQEVVYGGFMTYQVPVASIAGMTGLVVDHLAAHDPLPHLAVQEGTGDLRFRVVRGAADLRL